MLQPARPRRTGAILASVAVHVVGGALLVAAATWQLEPLPRPETQLVAAATLPAGSSAAGPPEPASRLERPEKRVVEELAQPSERAEDDAASRPEVGADDGDGDGSSAGDGSGDGDGSGSGTGLGIGLGLGTFCQGPEPCDGTADLPAAPPEPPEVVAPDLMEGRRIAGEPRILPPEVVRRRMLRSGQRSTRAVLKMCLDRSGRVVETTVLSSSGHPEYDRALRLGVRTWRYHPYTIDGARVAVCTALTFVYEMR